MTRLALTLLVLAAASTAAAQSQPTAKPESVYDRIWKFSEWYRNDRNPAVQRVLFTGRFHYDWAVLDSDQGDHEEANLRRLRLGPRVTFLKTFLFHAEVELNPQERNPAYVRLTDAYIQWTKNPQVVVTVGKQAVPFTQEGATSSRELLTIDRSQIGNNIWFPQEYLPGLSLSGRRGQWNYRAGASSAGAMNRELGEFNAGVATLGVVGYDFARTLGVREAILTGNYVYQHPDARNTFTRQLDHVGSINFRFDTGTWGLRTDVAAASGYLGQSGLTSVMVMPFYNLTPKLQAVTRYTRMDSDGPAGIRLNTYESRVVSSRGNEYNELYLGANYYFYAHRLKLQTGVQFADMNNTVTGTDVYSGTSWVTGLRVGW